MITLKDLIVSALVLCGAISDFNNFDIPYYVYGVLFVIYIISRASGRTKNIKSIDGDSLLGSK